MPTATQIALALTLALIATGARGHTWNHRSNKKRGAHNENG
ncbi:MAG: hypothetical protein WA661_19590 [Xanthobacteraceae bacterium]